MSWLCRLVTKNHTQTELNTMRVITGSVGAIFGAVIGSENKYDSNLQAGAYIWGSSTVGSITGIFWGRHFIKSIPLTVPASIAGFLYYMNKNKENN